MVSQLQTCGLSRTKYSLPPTTTTIRYRPPAAVVLHCLPPLSYRLSGELKKKKKVKEKKTPLLDFFFFFLPILL